MMTDFAKFKVETQSDTKVFAIIQDHAFWGVVSNVSMPWLASCERAILVVIHWGDVLELFHLQSLFYRYVILVGKVLN